MITTCWIGARVAPQPFWVSRNALAQSRRIKIDSNARQVKVDVLLQPQNFSPTLINPAPQLSDGKAPQAVEK
jgi:hypothetical protein